MLRLFTTLVVWVLLTFSALANPLTITSGHILFFVVDTSASFSGDDFSVSMFSGTGADFVPPFLGPSSTTVGLPICCGGATVIVDGAECVSNDFGGPIIPPSCGSVTLTTSEALPARPVGLPPQVTFSSTVPFTATGHLDVGSGFDIVGQGTVVGTLCGESCNNYVGVPLLDYEFSVPEPSTLLLLGTALGALVILHRHKTVWRP